MEKKNLLVIGESYNTFQKDSTDILANYFNNVFMFVKYNPITEISRYISIPSLDPFSLKSKIDLTNKPSNLNVISTPIFYASLDSQYKKIGEKLYDRVDKIIIKKNINFDMIHSHFTWPCGYVGMKLKEKYNVPFIVTAHGYDIYLLPFKDKDWTEKIRSVLNSADCIITVSKRNLECIKKLNVNTNVRVLPNGFKSDLFYMRNSIECRNTLNLPLDRKIILSIGNLSEIKGHKYLIETMQEISKHRKDILCIIVGAGPLDKNLRKQIIAAKLQNYVKLVGGKPHTEIPFWISACDLFVLPSLNEGNPTVLVECLGCGKPFIGTKVGGIPEIITSDDYGYLVEPSNAHDLTKSIEMALNKNWDEEKIVNYAEQYRWENITKQIQHIYCQLLPDEGVVTEQHMYISDLAL
ncbi:glycosyltransferase [Methanosarcina mazei]|uniref:Glycosyl transferase, group 1 n=1 Tax=Methanosarcina mazei LYC TaxID=1434114 RepID=A0A0E3RN15_METMZ|nr:glycosyltransferase [Methanosarcina mazei]AKB66674.1 Glycosyl transferase, group 1 [Methanosarcina mazei LYC]